MKLLYTFGSNTDIVPGLCFAYELNDTDANIIGHVTDKDTKEHLAYVTIMLKGQPSDDYRRNRALLPENLSGRDFYC